MSDSSDCEMPLGMARSAFDEACKPLKQARSTLSKARAKGLRTVAKNAQRVRNAKAKVKEFCHDWQRERDERRDVMRAVADGNLALHAKLDRVLAALSPPLPAASSPAVQPPAPRDAAAVGERPPPARSAAPAATAFTCAICQDAVLAADGGFELRCCRQWLHEDCLIPYSMSDAACPFCRRPWEGLLKRQIAELCHDTWRRTVQQRCTGEPIHLDPQGAFHARLCCGRQADLDDGHLVLDGTHYSLDALSFENDAIHGFVRKFLGGRWPKPGHTVLRVAAASGERQALRFRRFQNRFWAEPVVELDYDMAELDDESVVLPLGSITSAVAVNPWRADSERRFFGHDLGDAAGKLWVLQLRGGSPSVVRFVDVEDDLVELVLRFVDPYSEQRSAATASSIQLFAGPITLTPPASSAYSYRCSPLAAERVVKLTVFSRTATTTEYRVRILGFQGDRIHGACESPFHGHLAVDAGSVVLVRPA